MENIITVTSTESRIEASIEALKSDVKFVLFDMMKVLETKFKDLNQNLF